MTAGDEPDGGLGAGIRSAARFFWAWLIVATAMSVTGNVAHAVLHAPRARSRCGRCRAGAAGVLLAATHSVAVLVRSRAGVFTYWCALLMTLALASCAFVLSFDAPCGRWRTRWACPESIAWLWPCASDVAIAQATLCLLSLSRRGGAMQLRGASVAGDVVAEKRRPRPYEARPAAAGRNDSPGRCGDGRR